MIGEKRKRTNTRAKKSRNRKRENVRDQNFGLFGVFYRRFLSSSMRWRTMLLRQRVRRSFMGLVSTLYESYVAETIFTRSFFSFAKKRSRTVLMKIPPTLVMHGHKMGHSHRYIRSSGAKASYKEDKSNKIVCSVALFWQERFTHTFPRHQSLDFPLVFLLQNYFPLSLPPAGKKCTSKSRKPTRTCIQDFRSQMHSWRRRT